MSIVSSESEALRRKIIEEMTVDYVGELEKNFELAKRLIRITKEGKINLLFKDRLTGKEQVLLYLIGKIYAKEAGLVDTDEVGNDELVNELGLPLGSVLPILKELRDENKVRQAKRGKNAYHTIPINQIGGILSALDKKLTSSQ